MLLDRTNTSHLGDAADAAPLVLAAQRDRR
jgi:hypothetical protein